MTALDIDVPRTRSATRDLDLGVERLSDVSISLGRAEALAQFGQESTTVHRLVNDTTSDLSRLGRLLGLVADRAESADAAPIDLYDRWIGALTSSIMFSTGTAPASTSALHARDRAETGSDPLSLAQYGPVGGVVFVSNPSITVSRTTTTTTPGSQPPTLGAGSEDGDDVGFENEIGASVPIDSGTHWGRNARACDDDPESCHGEVTSDEVFAVLGFAPVIGDVLDAAFCVGGDNVSCAAVVVPLVGGKAIRLTADSFKAASRAADGFRITEKSWKHITDRHVAGGRNVTHDASLWFSENGIATHIGNARTWTPSHFNRGNTVIVADAGVTVGIDGVTRHSTSVYTVVLDSSGAVVTAHPGLPREIERWK